MRSLPLLAITLAAVTPAPAADARLAVLLLGDRGHHQPEAMSRVVIAVVSAVMFGLVLTRLGGEMTRHRRALARERSLREAAAALLVAADVAGVVAAVRTAVAELLRPGVPHEVLFGGIDDVSAHPYASTLSYPLGVTEGPSTIDSLVVAADTPELAGLHKSLLGWLTTADAAGLDQDGIVALFTSALRDFHERRGGTGNRRVAAGAETEGAA